jgi:predicted nucleic acid-binding protein
MIEDDRNHKEGLRIWGIINKAIVPTVVLFELAFFLVKQKLDLDLLRSVVNDPKVEIVENNLDDILYLVRNSKDVKHYDDVGDMVILSVARRLGIELKTFDEELGASYKSLGLN